MNPGPTDYEQKALSTELPMHNTECGTNVLNNKLLGGAGRVMIPTTFQHVFHGFIVYVLGCFIDWLPNLHSFHMYQVNEDNLFLAFKHYLRVIVVVCHSQIDG